MQTADDDDLLVVDEGGEPPPEVRERLLRVRKDIEERLAALDAENGEAFGDAVRATITLAQMSQILALSGAPPVVMDVHTKMGRGLLCCALKALGMQGRASEVTARAGVLIDMLRPFNDPDGTLDGPAAPTRH